MVDLPGFSVHVTDYLENRPRGAVRRFRATVTEEVTGKSASKEFGFIISQIPTVIEALVVREFSGSEAAQIIRKRRGEVIVSLRQDYSEDLYHELHNALRVSCDGPGTSLWFHYLANISPEIITILRTQIVSDLKALIGKAPTLAQIADHLRISWDKAFNEASMTSGRIINPNTQCDTDATGYKYLAHLKVSELERVDRELIQGTLMMAYLNERDWQNMAARLVNFEE